MGGEEGGGAKRWWFSIRPEARSVVPSPLRNVGPRKSRHPPDSPRTLVYNHRVWLFTAAIEGRQRRDGADERTACRYGRGRSNTGLVSEYHAGTCSHMSAQCRNGRDRRDDKVSGMMPFTAAHVGVDHSGCSRSASVGCHVNTIQHQGHMTLLSCTWKGYGLGKSPQLISDITLIALTHYALIVQLSSTSNPVAIYPSRHR
ncbi:hypothetical protein J1614_003293 [Plenodomus biglobosus]|nr:hypothetical protein J1614_003293 [Plenodomus biglobosus]